MIDKDVGFVLKRHNFRETSIIAPIYTLKFGKIKGVFKGFYTIKKEFSSPLEPFTLNEFIFYPRKQELWLVSFVDLMCDYPFLRKNIHKARIAALIFNIIDRTTCLWEKNVFVFQLIKNCLDWLAKEREMKILYTFLTQFLTFCGFEPRFGQCVLCLNNIGESFSFSTSKGGLVCFSCMRKIEDAHKISKQASSSILYIQKNNFSQSMRLNPTPDCEREIVHILKRFLHYHLDFDLRVV
jgi:DNA repair protein RecO (recombination protein O)